MHLSSEDSVEPGIIMNELKNESSRNLMAELIFDEIAINKDMVIDCLCRIEQKIIQNKLETLRTQLKNNNSDSDSMDLVLQITNLQKDKNNVKKQYLDV